jgi:hypothetical protein
MEWAMQNPNPTERNRARAIAIAKVEPMTNELGDVVMMSLAGLAATLILIAHFAGGGVLGRMFSL